MRILYYTADVAPAAAHNSKTAHIYNGDFMPRSRPYRPHAVCVKGKGSPCTINERRAPELIPVLGSQPAGDVSHKPGGRLPLLSARPAVTLATLKRAAVPVSLLGEQRHDGCEQFA